MSGSGILKLLKSANDNLTDYRTFQTKMKQYMSHLARIKGFSARKPSIRIMITVE